MADRAQLKRIAAAVGLHPVRIYLLDRGFSCWQWLCGRHLAKRKLDKWAVVSSQDPPHVLLCDDRHLYACGSEMQP